MTPNKLNALIVDDEPAGRENLKNLLNEFCRSINVIGVAESAPLARKMLKDLTPDVLFLDINMPEEDGFSLLNSIDGTISVVFVTAYDTYALRALRQGAFDYILKPVDVDELTNCEVRLLKKKQSLLNSDVASEYKEALKEIAAKLIGNKQQGRISIHHARGIKVVNISDIIRLSSDDNYTQVHLARERILVSKPLSSFLESLDNSKFFRIHRSHAINIDHMLEYIKDYNGYVLMSDGEKIEISRRRNGDFLQFMSDSFQHVNAL